MTIHIDGDAEAELASAFDWYEERGRPGLGGRFLRCVEEAIARLEDAPASFPVVLLERGTNLRRILVRDFPYQVIFGEVETPRGRELWVFAIAHLHREPSYWRGRVR